MSAPFYVCLESRRDSTSRLYVDLTESDIIEEAHSMASRGDDWTRAPFKDDGPIDIQGAIDYLCRGVDDGTAREYVLQAKALTSGVTCSGYGRRASRTPWEVAVRVYSLSPDECEECGCEGWHVDTDAGEIVRHGHTIASYDGADGRVPLMASAEPTSRLLCDDCAQAVTP